VLIDSATGEKQFYSEKKFSLFGDPIDLDVSLLEGTDVLLVDGFWMEAALKGAEWARQHNVPVVGDFKGYYEGMDRLLPLISYLIIPEFFALELTNKPTSGRNYKNILYSLKSMISGIPIITRGSEGGVYLVDNEVRQYKSFPIDCVDTTGAGDAFHGAFCHFLSKDFSIDMCLELSSAVGAMNCRSLGGRRSLPTEEELREFMKGYERS
jgi:sulfofructose kinase